MAYVSCNKCGTIRISHWIHTPKNDRGKVIGPPEKHVNCPICKEHWVYERVEGERYLVPRLLPQLEMF